MQSGALSCTCRTWARVYDGTAFICRELTSKMVDIFDERHSRAWSKPEACIQTCLEVYFIRTLMQRKLRHARYK